MAQQRVDAVLTAASVMFMIRDARAMRGMTARRVGADRVEITTAISDETYLSIHIAATSLGVADHLEHMAAELRRQHRAAEVVDSDG